MQIDVAPSSSFTSFAYDVWTRGCAHGAWIFSVERLANGKVSIYRDSKLEKEVSRDITRDHIAKKAAGENYDAQYRVINACGIKRFRVVFSPYRNGQQSSA